MRRVLVAAVVAGLALAVSAPSFAGDVEKGKEIYAAQKCKMCHSIDGVGNKKGSLDDVGNKYSLEDLKAWIVNPVEMTKKTEAKRSPKMKNKYDDLSAEEVDALVAYMASLKKAE